jgi:galactokinase
MQTVMVVMNTAKKEMKINPAKYDERTKGFSKMKNILTAEISGLREFSTNANASVVYELLK